MGTNIIFILYFIFWIIGISIALFLGNLVTPKFVSCMRAQIKRRANDLGETEEKVFNDAMKRHPSFPDWLVGISERLFFLILVAFNISGTAVAMMLWITLKMLYNWSILIHAAKVTVTYRHLAISGLLGGLCSMFFALIGGLICRIPFLLT